MQCQVAILKTLTVFFDVKNYFVISMLAMIVPFATVFLSMMVEDLTVFFKT